MELTIDDDFKNLIPPLKKDEFEKLEKNILQDGIRDKLIIWEETIIDGHNRYEIAKKHKLDFGVKRLHFISKEEAINWMLNNQLGRRNLTPQQRVDVLFNADELIKSIYEKGKKKHVQNAERLNEKKQFSSTEENRKPHNSVKEIAEMAETSPATVSRMRKLKREDEGSYKKVVDGEVGLYTAYNNLPTVNSASAKKDGFVKNDERGDKNAKSDSRRKKDALYRFENEDVSKEESEKLLLESKGHTLKNFMEQISLFLKKIDDLEEVISLKESDKDFFIKHNNDLENIVQTIKKIYGSVSE